MGTTKFVEAPDSTKREVYLGVLSLTILSLFLSHDGLRGGCVQTDVFKYLPDDVRFNISHSVCNSRVRDLLNGKFLAKVKGGNNIMITSKGKELNEAIQKKILEMLNVAQ